jgi:hypothetical protein
MRVIAPHHNNNNNNNNNNNIYICEIYSVKNITLRVSASKQNRFTINIKTSELNDGRYSRIILRCILLLSVYSRGGMTNCDALNRRVLEGNEGGMVEVLLRHLPVGTEERQETNLLGQRMY